MASAMAGELGLITRGIAVQARAETAVLAALSSIDQALERVCAWGATPGRDGLPPPLPADGFVGRALGFERAAVEPLDPERDPSLGVAASGARLTHAAGVAVRPPDGPPGALCLGFAGLPPRDIDLTLWLLEGHAWMAAMCTHDPGVLGGLLAAARLDGLTGCLNQAAICEQFAREVRRSERNDRALACCFIDLDDFKTLNDRDGHLYGSRVLAEVAAALRGGVRLVDTVGRYGGDEFVVLLPDTDASTACMLAERLGALIRSLRVDGSLVALDASIGVAQWQPGMTADQLLAAADAALLRAKRRGGGHVRCADVAASSPGARGATTSLAEDDEPIAMRRR